MTQNGCVRRSYGVCKFGVMQAGTLVVFLLLGSIAARAQQPAFVQQATATYHQSSTVTVTLPSAPRFGDALVLSSANDSVYINSVTGGNVNWVRFARDGQHSVVEIWYGLNSSGPSSNSSITVTYSDATGSGGVNLSEFSGVVFRGLGGGGNAGVSATPSVGARGGTNVLVVAAVADQSTDPTTAGPTNGFTALAEAVDTNKIIPAYRVLPSDVDTGTSWTEGIGGWDALAVEFAPVGPGVFLSSISLSQSSVTAGNGATGTVTLNTGFSPTQTDTTVAMESTNPSAVQVPSSVTIPAGSNSATFPVTTSLVTTVSPVSIIANYNGEQTATLTVNPSGASVTLVQQATASFGLQPTVTATLSSAPQAGDGLVLFSANDNVNITSVSGGGVNWVLGSASGDHSVAEIWYGLNSSGSGSSITVTYTDASGSGGINVSEFSGVAASNALDIAPGSQFGVSTMPTTSAAQTGNGNDLILAAAADQSPNPTTAGPTNSFVALTEAADPSASMAKVIPAYLVTGTTGSYGTSWTETTNDGWDAVIVALKGSGSSSGVFLSSVSVSPSSVAGGTSSTGTVTLTGPATGGGITVDLTSSDTSLAQVPSTVTVPSGSSSVTFTVTTSAAMTPTPVTISANFNGTLTANLTVTPPGGGGGPKTFVQQAVAQYAGTNQVVVALNAQPQAGDALVLFSSNDSVNISSVSGGGVNWVLGSASGDHSVVEIWYGLNSSGSATPITVTYAGTGSGGVNVSEFSGVNTINALDTAPGSAFGFSSTPATPTATTTNANDLILAAAAYQNLVAPTIAGPTNSFTALTEAHSQLQAGGSKIIPAYQIVSATGSYSTSWTENFGAEGWDAVIVALK